jgi:hypothetical protein
MTVGHWVGSLLCPSFPKVFIKTCCESVKIDESLELNDVQNVLYRTIDKSINVVALQNDFTRRFLEVIFWSIIKNMGIKFYDENKNN